ncbi:MAG: RNA 3'-phosphate cyclase [Anaerolineae bacterium]|nr:RNA 3'-phosphate cyclase [Anaerolineae bacterium]
MTPSAERRRADDRGASGPGAEARSSLVVIDGSHGEGGGQILRTSLTMAVLTGRPTRVERIRAGRSRPGLRPQHLTAVRAAAAVCGGAVEGDQLGSQEVTLKPQGRVFPGEYAFDVTEAAQGGSAGSVGLVLQTLLLPLAVVDGKSQVLLHGGTHVAWAPSVSYVEHVFLPTLGRMGVRADVEVIQWGFYPVGGGTARVVIAGRQGMLKPITLTKRGDVQRVWGIAAVTNLPSHIPQRMANRARNVLAEEGLKARVEPRRLRGDGPGAGIFLFVEYEHVTAGFTSYGRKGLPAERVAEAACEDLLLHHRSGAPVDPHLADQLVLPMAMASGESRLVTSKITQHLLTNVWVVEQFLDCTVKVEGQEGRPGTLVVEAEQATLPQGRGEAQQRWAARGRS